MSESPCMLCRYTKAIICIICFQLLIINSIHQFRSSATNKTRLTRSSISHCVAHFSTDRIVNNNLCVIFISISLIIIFVGIKFIRLVSILNKGFEDLICVSSIQFLKRFILSDTYTPVFKLPYKAIRYTWNKNPQLIVGIIGILLL